MNAAALVHDDRWAAEVRPVMLAFSVLIPHLATLPSEDRQEVLRLLNLWSVEEDAADREDLVTAMEEILSQRPVQLRPMNSSVEAPRSPRLRSMTAKIGRGIKRLREKRGWSQTQLAERAGLTQSHVSRLENGEHSPTHLTLSKLAEALEVALESLDPSAMSHDRQAEQPPPAMTDSSS